jgi:hypothetical protein
MRNQPGRVARPSTRVVVLLDDRRDAVGVRHSPEHLGAGDRVRRNELPLVLVQGPGLPQMHVVRHRILPRSCSRPAQ